MMRRPLFLRIDSLILLKGTNENSTAMKYFERLFFFDMLEIRDAKAVFVKVLLEVIIGGFSIPFFAVLFSGFLS